MTDILTDTRSSTAWTGQLRARATGHCSGAAPTPMRCPAPGASTSPAR